MPKVHVDMRVMHPGERMVSPDCDAGKHTACSGGAWDFEYDAATACECGCHEEESA
jgi:hypothetical protein